MDGRVTTRTLGLTTSNVKELTPPNALAARARAETVFMIIFSRSTFGKWKLCHTQRRNEDSTEELFFWFEFSSFSFYLARRAFAVLFVWRRVVSNVLLLVFVSARDCGWVCQKNFQESKRKDSIFQASYIRNSRQLNGTTPKIVQYFELIVDWQTEAMDDSSY